jgi:hypothetical protein
MKRAGRILVLLVAVASLFLLGCTYAGNGGGLQVIALVQAYASDAGL